MFQELLELLKRYVLAHERLAAANEKQAENTALLVRIQLPGAMGMTPVDDAPVCEDGSECTAGRGPLTTGGDAAPYGAQPPAQTPSPADPPAAPPSGWDPYTAPVMKQYKGDKGAILKAELAKFGIDPGDKMTGAQMHELLLEKAAEKKDPVAPVPPAAPVTPVPPMAPVAPAAPAGPSAPLLTMPGAPVAPPAGAASGSLDYELVKQAVYALYDRGPAGQAEALRLLQEIGGSTKLADPETQTPCVPQDKWLPLYNAAIEAVGRM